MNSHNSYCDNNLNLENYYSDDEINENDLWVKDCELNNRNDNFFKYSFSTYFSSNKCYAIINNKKKRGRKKRDNKDNDNKIIHSKYDNDNIIYKLKVNCMRNILYLINDLIWEKYQNPKLKLQKISGRLIRDGKKKKNLQFFNSTIKDILLMERTRKIKNKEVIKNQDIIQKIEKDNNEDELLIVILNYTFIDYLNKIYICINEEDFQNIFKVKSNYLFVNLEIDEKQKEKMKSIVENDIIKYYENIHERNRKKKNKN